MKALAALFIPLCLASALAQDKPFTIGEIEFFGYSHLNLDRIKTALPLHEGDMIAIEDFPATKEKIGQFVRREIGREATDVKFVCCDDHGNLMIFVGLPGESTRSFQYNPRPKGSSRLPRSILDLYQPRRNSTWKRRNGNPVKTGPKATDYQPMSLCVRLNSQYNNSRYTMTSRSGARYCHLPTQTSDKRPRTYSDMRASRELRFQRWSGPAGMRMIRFGTIRCGRWAFSHHPMKEFRPGYQLKVLRAC